MCSSSSTISILAMTLLRGIRFRLINSRHLLNKQMAIRRKKCLKLKGEEERIQKTVNRNSSA
jgi:hypothetical protein